MYEIALSVSACVRSNTHADLVWLLSPNPLPQPKNGEVIAFTPGGGKFGSVLGGAFDGHFIDITSLKLSRGRIVDVHVGPLEASLTGISLGSTLTFMVIPAHTLESELWPALNERESVAIVAYVENKEVTRTEVFTSATILAADPQVAEIFNQGKTTVADLGDRIVTVYTPVTRLIVAGSGAIADALESGAKALGWQVSVDPRSENFAGLAATLSDLDAAVIMGHDVENSSRCLASALDSKAGYIGALGSMKMQENRADWLAYRDITDLSRVHGPAGFDIGASTPAEIAVSVLAEAIAVLKGK
jgi:xanthine dehydrogenase accessory factor